MKTKASHRSQFFSQESLPKTFVHFEINLIECASLPAKDVNGFSVSCKILGVLTLTGPIRYICYR
jgi:hypothetical protein